MITHRYSWKNGQPRMRSSYDTAINEAFIKLHEAHGTDWVTVEVRNLPCDDESHYPDGCNHFEVTIKEPTDEEPGPYVHCPECSHWLRPTGFNDGKTYCVWCQEWVILS